MADIYSNYAELSQTEEKGIDYRIRCVSSSDVLIVAPHGGGIEPGTTQIAEALAENQYSFYSFEGLKRTGNWSLHITSTNFDEPLALELLKTANQVITIHGVQGDEEEVVYLGGLDDELKHRIKKSLLCLSSSQDIDLKVGMHDNPRLQGINPRNICNRGNTKKGVQLEITRKLRDTLKKVENQDKFERFILALRSAVPHPIEG